MTRQIRVRSVARQPIDEHKLAMAYVLLARILVADAKSAKGSPSSDASEEKA